MFAGGLPSPIFVDEGGMENLTVVLSGNLCGEVEVYFQVSHNVSLITATQGTDRMLESTNLYAYMMLAYFNQTVPTCMAPTLYYHRCRLYHNNGIPSDAEH